MSLVVEPNLSIPTIFNRNLVKIKIYAGISKLPALVVCRWVGPRNPESKPASNDKGQRRFCVVLSCFWSCRWGTTSLRSSDIWAAPHGQDVQSDSMSGDCDSRKRNCRRQCYWACHHYGEKSEFKIIKWYDWNVCLNALVCRSVPSDGNHQIDWKFNRNDVSHHWGLTPQGSQ